MQISTGGAKGRKKGVNFDLNLVPFIDVLSVCICFLLVTTVFMSLGSFHAHQAIGDESSQQKAEDTQSMMVSFGEGGTIKIDLQKGEKTYHSDQIRGQSGKVNVDRLDQWLAALSKTQKEFKGLLKKNKIFITK